MKILHIASFVGNIGDNISHIGLKSVLDNFFVDYSIKRVEIRKFYKNYKGADKRFFDKSFLTNLKDFDLCIIGGGGFFDYWVPDSKSGTTIDIDPELISSIDTPVLFCSIGCIPHREVPEGNISKFRAFLDACSENPLVKIILRNDGSYENVVKNIGQKYEDILNEGVDNGFFIDNSCFAPAPFDGKYVAINVSSDQLLMKSQYRGLIEKELYYEELSKALSYICISKKLNVVFVPHIFSDLEAIYELLRRVDDYIVRTKVSISSCVQFDQGAMEAASVYQGSILTLGTRFHANIIPLALGRPAIGLAALDRVKCLYDSVGLPDNYVFVHDLFSKILCEKIDSVIGDEIIHNSFDKFDMDSKKKNALELYGHVLRSMGLGGESPEASGLIVQ